MRVVYKCACGRRVRPRVTKPPKKHEILYYEFVNQALGGVPGVPEHGKKYRRLVRVTAMKREWFLPRARGTKHDLVPPPDGYPCELCNTAVYNAKCVHQDDCLAYAYWCTTCAGHLDQDARKSIAKLLRKKGKTCGVKPAASSRRT